MFILKLMAATRFRQAETGATKDWESYRMLQKKTTCLWTISQVNSFTGNRMKGASFVNVAVRCASVWEDGCGSVEGGSPPDSRDTDPDR